jgi:hypothetical protein
MKLTEAQKRLKKSLIVSVHLSKRYREYYKEHEDEYREFLMEHFGVSSSKDLSIDELIELKEYFNFRRDGIKKRDLEKITKLQKETILKLWDEIARDKSERALIWFLKRFEGKLVIDIDLLSKKGAQKAIIALKKIKGGNENK